MFFTIMHKDICKYGYLREYKMVSYQQYFQCIIRIYDIYTCVISCLSVSLLFECLFYELFI